jgi:hypothetical protein
MEDALSRPIFILGCGRSGTTLTGELIGRHPGVRYLNEPRHLWTVDPRTDTWSRPHAQVVLTNEDVTSDVANDLRRAFSAKSRSANRRRIVEKTPINCFRVRYIDSIFPDAHFVHVLRDGRDVAASIGELCKTDGRSPSRRVSLMSRARGSNKWGPWYGKEDVKWHALRDLASDDGVPYLSAADSDPLLRGLVEWRLATTSACRDLAAIDASRCVEFRYEELVRAPGETMSRVLDAVNLAPDSGVTGQALRRVSGRPTRRSPLSKEGEAIAGGLLTELGYLRPEENTP